MRRASWITLVLVLAAGLAALQGQESDPAAEKTAEDLADVPVPPTPRELLASTVGDWRLTIRVWSSPESEPSESVGTASGRWILGERFVETTYRGEVMERPFEGLRIEGYEKASEEYVSTWRDNFGSYTLVFRGRCPDPCRVRTLLASFLDPVSSQTLRIKGVTTVTGADSYSYESFVVTPAGAEFKNMELVAQRTSS